jgi:hypothetical protein
MFAKAYFKCRRIAWAIVAGGIATVSIVTNAHAVFLGPENPGAENGFDAWYNGVLGGGLAAIDHDDPATGSSDFKIGINDAASHDVNHADIRSQLFSLTPIGKKRGPITFSFAYKLPEKVNPGDNMEVYLRFFDEQGQFLGQKMYRVGSSTHDSEMTRYKTKTITKIFAPPKAAQADVWIVANIFSHWTSGNAHFDDFSVTVPSPMPWAKIFVGIGIFAVLTAGFMSLRLYARRRREWQMAGALTQPSSQGILQRLPQIKMKTALIIGACVLAVGTVISVMLLTFGSKTIKIKAYIDGADTIKIQGKIIWYEHESFDLPGDHDTKPTLINGTPWFPQWKDNISTAYTKLKPAFEPRYPADIKLANVIGRGEVKISEMPSPANNQILSIHIYDEPGGADWYEVTIKWR